MKANAGGTREQGSLGTFPHRGSYTLIIWAHASLWLREVGSGTQGFSALSGARSDAGPERGGGEWDTDLPFSEALPLV